MDLSFMADQSTHSYHHCDKSGVSALTSDDCRRSFSVQNLKED